MMSCELAEVRTFTSRKGRSFTTDASCPAKRMKGLTGVKAECHFQSPNAQVCTVAQKYNDLIHRGTVDECYLSNKFR